MAYKRKNTLSVEDARKNFIEEITRQKENFKEFYFDRYSNLVLVFKTFDRKVLENTLYATGIACAYYKNKPKVEIRLDYKFPNDEVSEDSLDYRAFHGEVLKIIGVSLTEKDREKAQRKEKKRIKKINVFLGAKTNEDSPILLKEIITQKVIPVKPSEILKDAAFVENPGQGYYRIHYNDNSVKKVFYDDFSENIHGVGSGMCGYCYDSVQERNTDLKKRHRSTALLNKKLLVFSSNIMLEYFHFCMRKQRVMFSLEPNEEKAFNLRESEYADMHRVHKFKAVKKVFEKEDSR